MHSLGFPEEKLGVWATFRFLYFQSKGDLGVGGPTFDLPVPPTRALLGELTIERHSWL